VTSAATLTDHGRDLARVEAELGEAGPTRTAVAAGPDAVTRVLQLHLQRASLTGRPSAHDVAEQVANRALAALGPWPDLCLLRADLAVRTHRLGDARHELARAPETLRCTQGRAVMVDVLVQEGDVDGAEELAEGLVAEERTWDHLARLAHLALVRGDVERADRLYADAQDEITAKSMRSFAWVEVERGRLCLLTGEPGRAHDHYDRAARAYSGHWTLALRLGELDAAVGRRTDAIRRLETVLARTGRPEVSQTLASLYERVGDVARARKHRRRALAEFVSSAFRGEVVYLHHLAEAADPTAAVGWARRDLELRPNHLTRAALAVALLRDGREAEARTEIALALATGLRDPRLLARAALVLGGPAGEPSVSAAGERQRSPGRPRAPRSRTTAAAGDEP
jgi:tetratricopeptide (TPR) repeat protein